MERGKLGRTGLMVSRFAFGTGYLESPVASGARLLVRAYDVGVDFWGRGRRISSIIVEAKVLDGHALPTC